MGTESRNFHHPFTPYPVQVEFMSALYDCIESGKVGIFESPTGTGKSLSLLCGSLTWLRHHQSKAWRSEDGDDQANDEPAWVQEQSLKLKREAFLSEKKELEARLARIRQKELRQRHQYNYSDTRYKRPKVDRPATQTSRGQDEDLEFLLDDYESEGESMSRKTMSQGFSTTTLSLLEKLGMITKSENNDDSAPEQPVQVFYASRTHSQLIQFANEARRIEIPIESDSPENLVGEGGPHSTDVEGIKHLPLGSRKNLCINPKVQSLRYVTAINERCLEMQKGKAKDKSRCEFLPSKENETLVHQFRDHTLADIRDIEDLGALGKKIGICPYYASRAALKQSELITLPYPLMLQKSARDALDISLKDHVVIIDEAHNLMDAISGIHSVQISLGQLKRARSQVRVYLRRFSSKLKGKNRMYVTQVVRLIDSINDFLEEKSKIPTASDGIVSIVDLLAGKAVDQINLFKLSRYLQESKLARKVDGYTEHVDQKEEGKLKRDRDASPVLMQVHSFIMAMTNPGAEGRFFFTKTDQADGVCLKYLLLDVVHHFRDIVDEAKAVILAGGTMSPMDDYVQHLFPYLDSYRMMTLSCGHVIPKENLIALPLSTGPTGVTLDFTYEKRGLLSVIDELGRCILELATVIPDGVVVFFSSYAYLNQVVSKWKQSSARIGASTSSSESQSIWNRISLQKPIFREVKESGNENGNTNEDEDSSGTGTRSESNTHMTTDSLLAAYSAAIASSSSGSSGRSGAILLAVIGGKLSEGINFSDALGRAVVVAGLPFPNAQSAEWTARLDHIEQRAIATYTTAAASAAATATAAASAASTTAAKAAGSRARREFYENACMRAVNQCVGRAIRHRGDYASIVLLDARYRTERIRGKLPGWIREGLVMEDANARGFAEGVRKIEGFFAGKKGH